MLRENKNFKYSLLKGLSERLLLLSQSDPTVSDVIVSTSTQHYPSIEADRGFGCGYRNIQMLLSSLRQDQRFVRLVWPDGQSVLFSFTLSALYQYVEEKYFYWRSLLRNFLIKNSISGRNSVVRQCLSERQTYKMIIQIVPLTCPQCPASSSGLRLPGLLAMTHSVLTNSATNWVILENGLEPQKFTHSCHRLVSSKYSMKYVVVKPTYKKDIFFIMLNAVFYNCYNIKV